MPRHGSPPLSSVGTETEAPEPLRVVKAASGVKKFVTNRLAKISSIFQQERPDTGHQVYLAETDEKHADSWEKGLDGCWIRHHRVPRRDPFVPSGAPDGPPLADLEEQRVTERSFPDGTSDRLQDRWRTDVQLVDDVSLWRGKTIFYTKTVQPKTGPSTPVDQNHTPATGKPRQEPRSTPKKGRLRKLLEICSFILGMCQAAINSDNTNWHALTPMSIEQGFDLLTQSGRDAAEKYIKTEKPDLIIGEWMCDPFSSWQHVNMGKGELTAEKILEKRRTHGKLVDWIAKIERWQRTVNKRHWPGEQPEKCGS